MTTIWMDPVDLRRGVALLHGQAVTMRDSALGVLAVGSGGAPHELAGTVAAETEAIAADVLRAAIAYLQEAVDTARRVEQVEASQAQAGIAAMLALSGPDARITAVSGEWTLRPDGTWASPVYTVDSVQARFAAAASVGSGFGHQPGVPGSPGEIWQGDIVERSHSQPGFGPNGPRTNPLLASGNPQLIALAGFMSQSSTESSRVFINSGNGVSYARGGIYTDWDSGRTGSVFSVHSGAGGRNSVI